jgi:dTDP-4-dehydrorhamnose reductase
MVLLLGASGYVGHAFAGELRRRGHCFIPLTRRAMDYTRFELLFDYVRKMKPEFIINAAGLTGSPNVDACELAREEILAANTLLPQTVARVCAMTHTPWGQVSSGCIYSGAKVLEDGRRRVEKDLNQPEFRRFLAEQPENVFGFTEWDEPNFSFRCPPCNFYSGTKVLAEEAIRGPGPTYIWRPGIPFDEREDLRNFLWRIQKYRKRQPRWRG